MSSPRPAQEHAPGRRSPLHRHKTQHAHVPALPLTWTGPYLRMGIHYYYYTKYYFTTTTTTYYCVEHIALHVLVLYRMGSRDYVLVRPLAGASWVVAGTIGQRYRTSPDRRGYYFVVVNAMYRLFTPPSSRAPQVNGDTVLLSPILDAGSRV